MNREEREALRIGALTGAVLLLALLGWVLSSAAESRAYNRLTGASTTTWDAMFLDLRVQSTPRADR